MNTRARLKSVSSGFFSSTFWPSTVVTASCAPVVFTHPAGTVPSAYESKPSFHGSGRTTRARALPLRAPTVAVIEPACSTGSDAIVTLLLAAVPLRPSSVQVAPVSSLRNRPLSSNSRTRSFTVWPGVSASSVGETCRCAGAPVPAWAGSSMANPVTGLAWRGPMA